MQKIKTTLVIEVEIEADFDTTLTPAEERVAEHFVKTMIGDIVVNQRGADARRLAEIATRSGPAYGVKEERAEEIRRSLRTSSHEVKGLDLGPSTDYN